MTVLSSGLKAQQRALHQLYHTGSVDDLVLEWSELKEVVGFEDYYAEEARYKHVDGPN